MNKALDVQVGGSHYKNLKIQPVEYIRANNIGYFEGNVIKYITRWKDKNGVEDLKKVIHYTQLLIEFEEKENASKDCSGQYKSIGKANCDVRAGVLEGNPCRTDDTSPVQSERTIIQSRASQQEFVPPSSISEHVRREQARNEQQRRAAASKEVYVQGPMGSVGIRGSTIFYGYGEAGPA